MSQPAGAMLRAVSYVGVLRALLYGLAIVIMLLAPFSGGPVAYSGWAMVPNLIVPALVPIIFFVLMLDLMMSAIFRADAAGDSRRRYGRLVKVNLALGVCLLASWLPFFLSIGS